MKLTVEEYVNKVKSLEIRLDLLDAQYEKHGQSLSDEKLDEMEADKNAIAKETTVLTMGMLAAIGMNKAVVE